MLDDNKYEIESMFIPFERDVPSVLYEPVNSTERDHIAFVFMHPDADFLSHPGAKGLTERGYRAMGVNNHSSHKGSYHLHDLLPDLGMAVKYLREQPTIETVVLAGHSGGTHLSSFYQNVAENGWGAARDDAKIYPAPPDMPDLPPADGVVLLDGHTGYGPKGLLDLGAQVADESGRARHNRLDMYAPGNGFDPDGPSSYDNAFLKRYFRAQADRMERLTAMARNRVSAVKEGYGKFVDDEPFVVTDIKSRVYKTNPNLLSHTKGEWPLVRADGPRTEERIHSVRGVRETNSQPPVRYHGDEVMPMTVQTYLSTHTVRLSSEFRLTKDSIEGIDFDSTNASTIGNLRGVTVPLLILPVTGHYFVVQGEMFHQNAASNDKSLVYIEGGDHGFEPVNDQYGDTFGATFDEVATWAAERFV